MAGVSLDDKIYAIGGGNANDCFSEVEILDLNIGRWVRTRSMVQEVMYINHLVAVKFVLYL